VRPDIVFERRDVEVADRDHRPARIPLSREPGGQLVEKSQLVGKFRIELGVGNVAARWDIDVVQLDAARQFDDGVAAVGAGTPGARRRRAKGLSGQNGDAIIALHAVHQHVTVSKRLECFPRE
jgi:hypothetical protein